ncbi:MAG: ABC transporter ATP-binding protein [Planctomycetota bacterium]|nr:ABC transporter ATP-binding protein [Planctomycetota bacterium]
MLRIHELTVQYSCASASKWFQRISFPRPLSQNRETGKSKAASNRAVLDHLNLDLARGEFLAILGVSGAGKTTLLRAIAGLLRPSSGEILIDGQPQTHKPPHQRDVAYVFQSGGWYDHLTVRQHFQLGKSSSQGTSKASSPILEDWLDRVGLTDLANQSPGQLSGGQLQRLAIGRALARQKSLLLLDEPLSQLDEPSCDELRRLLQKIHSEGSTIIYVTHSQRDAFMLSTKVAALHEGVLRQMASPHELYDQPQHISVAKSLGFPAMDLLAAKHLIDDVPVHLRVGTKWEKLSPETIVGVRPRDWKLNPTESSGGTTFKGTWAGRTFIDGMWLGRVVFQEKVISVLVSVSEDVERLTIGDPVVLYLDARHLHCFDPITGNRIQLG